MRADSKPQPPSLKHKHNSAPLAAGRPKFFGYNEERQIWVAVQEVKSLTGLSINEICRMHKFNTLAGGFDPADHHYSITGETLRRRYYDAVRLLRAEQREREETILLFKRFGAHSPLLDSPLPIASVWSAELRCRLA